MSSLSTAPPAYAEKPGTHIAPPTDIKHTQDLSESTTRVPKHDIPAAVTTLQVDYTWKNLTARISEPSNPSQPIYIVDYRTFKSPHLLFKDAADNTFGSGTLHAVSINADYELHGQKGKLKALRHFHTEYTHLSRVYSKNGAPAAMNWSSDCDFRNWDFTCKGEDGVPVARFVSNCWSLKKVGMIEFYGPLGQSKEAREEIVVTGLTLFSCMVLRTTSLLSFFGGVFARPGPLPNPEAEKVKGEGEDGK
ncbi:hypothetical protein VFPPC_04122 [Pochonia chlamydosporia 170]|uniref:Uncharacterized protein n=1 Tax=Pochonia chlamydosporia 170 TaxID=1380566 RepID=A0A179FRE1_METCM|nr:hypothetical protein VFPPC_04122 [Pochonia chlamydosporia 170]OAQ67770.1 hypothetical protein VFPPC_04122 [Pochonia chlamydosporia 170]